jgi:hypothetical protein
LPIHSDNRRMEEAARACHRGQVRARVKYLGTRCVLPLVVMFVVGSGHLQAHEGFDFGKLELIRNEQEYAAFSRAQRDSELGKNAERLRIAEYNLHLSRETAAFQRHISDMRQRHVSCKVCKAHVKKIRYLSKRIEQGMK